MGESLGESMYSVVYPKNSQVWEVYTRLGAMGEIGYRENIELYPVFV